MSNFYDELDKRTAIGLGVARLLSERPENLHEYQGCALPVAPSEASESETKQHSTTVVNASDPAQQAVNIALDRASDAIIDARRAIGGESPAFKMRHPDGHVTLIAIETAEERMAAHMREIAEFKGGDKPTYAQLLERVKELEGALQDQRNGDLAEQEEFADICAQEQIPYSNCCPTRHCALAPFKYIDTLRKQIEELKSSSASGIESVALESRPAERAGERE